MRGAAMKRRRCRVPSVFSGDVNTGEVFGNTEVDEGDYNMQGRGGRRGQKEKGLRWIWAESTGIVQAWNVPPRGDSFFFCG